MNAVIASAFKGSAPGEPGFSDGDVYFQQKRSKEPNDQQLNVEKIPMTHWKNGTVTIMKQALTATRARQRGPLQALDQIRILMRSVSKQLVALWHNSADSLVCAITRARGEIRPRELPLYLFFFLNHVFLCFNLATSESKHIRALQLKGLLR